MKNLWIVASVAQSLDTLIPGQPNFLSAHCNVTLVAADEKRLMSVANREEVRAVPVEIGRRPSPVRDLLSIVKLTRHLWQEKPEIVQTYTPKAGLLGQFAARLARVPHRVHGVVGLPLMEARGMRRWLMVQIEKVTYANSTVVTANSFELADFIRTYTKKKVSVVGRGSINGVDLRAYAPNREMRDKVRRQLGVGDTSIVFVYVGRLVPEKGVSELVQAFLSMRRTNHNLELVIVGNEEADLNPLPHSTLKAITCEQGIHRVGWCTDVRPYLAGADVFVLPSYREGLPNSLLEAMAMGLPSVASNISGCREVIDDGHNGLLVSAKNSAELERAMRQLVGDVPERLRMGEDARRHVSEKYDQDFFWGQLLNFYHALAN